MCAYFHEVHLMFKSKPRDQFRPIVYRGTSLIRNSDPAGPYSRNMPRALWWS